VVRHFNLRSATAVHVLEVVAGSPAAEGGIAVGDRLIALDGVPVAGIDALQRLLDSSRIGRDCEAELLRRSAVIRVKLTPIELATHNA
jgi:S1-C subfamily serine protease